MVWSINMKKHLILSCLAAFTLISLVGCADDERHSSTDQSSSTSMAVDTKDMNHHGASH